AEEVGGKIRHGPSTTLRTFGGQGLGAERRMRGSGRMALEASFGGEARAARFAVAEGIAGAAEENGAAKPAVLAVPESFLAGALELFKSGGGEGRIAAAKAGRVGMEAFSEFVDPGVADAEKPGDAVGGPFGRRRLPPLPDELLDDAGFEGAAPGKRRAATRGASFLNVDQARLASARRFVAGSLAAHGAILRGEFRPRGSRRGERAGSTA